MKKILNVAIAVIIAATALTGCKKGANDPFFSLKSRTARLKGNWKLVKEDKTETNSSGTTTYTYDGTNMTVKDNNGDVTTYSYELTITFDKAGTFSNQETVTATNGDYRKTTTDGQWAFIGKNKDAGLKNKEAIVFTNTKSTDEIRYTDPIFGTVSTSSNTTTGSGDFTSLIAEGWTLDKLSSKEMIVTVDNTTTDSNGNTTTITATFTFEKQ